MKFIKFFAFAIILFTANTAFSQTTATDSLEISDVKVKGITCAMDLKTISGNVEEIDGVSSFETKKQGATSTFELTYNPAIVSEKKIFAVIENTPGCDDPNARPYKVKQ